MDVNDMIKDEDLVVHKFNSNSNGIGHGYFIPHQAHNIQNRVARMVPSFIAKRPSARELNKLKRKAKVKDQVKNWPENGETDASSPQLPASSKGPSPELSTSTKVCIFGS